MSNLPAAQRMIAERLKNARVRSGLSLRQAAKQTGVSHIHIWDIERGKSNNPTIDTLRKLADGYKMSVGYLVGEIEDADGSFVQALCSHIRQLPMSSLCVVWDVVTGLKRHFPK